MKNNYFTENRLPIFKLLLVILSCVGVNIAVFSQNITVVGANMESSTGWTIYNMGSTVPASYEFGYTPNSSSKGTGGCLRVTSTKKTDILFWQKVKLKAGKKYIVDCAAKTNLVKDFWLEMFLSTTAPIETQDYNPSGNLVLGLSTWVGCGSYLDGLMSNIACNGNRSYIPSGTYNTDIDIYFGIKTGIYNDMTTQMEVLIDEVTITEVDDNKLLSTVEGTLDATNLKITNVSSNLKASKFRAGLHSWPNATISLIGNVGNKVMRITQLDSMLISDTLSVKVTGSSLSTVYKLELRPTSNGVSIISSSLGVVDEANGKLTGVPSNVKAAQLKAALSLSDIATIKITNNVGVEVTGATVISSNNRIQVIAEDGSIKNYNIETGNALAVESLLNYKVQVNAIENRILELSGNSEIHIASKKNPLAGSSINLKSQDCWIYFDNIKPQDVYDKYLNQILVNGSAASVDVNVRLTQYYQGTVVISHSSTYKALAVYSQDNFKGYFFTPLINTYNRAAELGTYNNNICSFTLKKGYMVTFADDELGTGASKVYVAADNDIVINKLPGDLYKKSSFVRIIPWRWTTKKGWCGVGEGGDKGPVAASEALNCSWRYNWDAGSSSTLNIEYIPIKQKSGWPSTDLINTKIGSTHALGFNEPDRSDQANMTVQQAINAWPDLLKSGLRLGSPCPSDGGLTWLFNFMHACDSLNYRVDFVAMHFYLGGQSALSFYNRLKWIHETTNRPIWITEWNNGANWTDAANGKPTYESQAIKIAQFIEMLDTTSFVERYSIYEWVEDTRQMFYDGPPVLTPAGEVYRDKISPRAYNPGLLPASTPVPAHNSTEIKLDTLLSWTNGNWDFSQTTFKVYFGTTNPPSFVVKQTGKEYNPGLLENNTTYYWRIDEVTDYGEKTGTVWSFTTKDTTSIIDTTTVNTLYKKKDSKVVKVYPVPASDILFIDGLSNEESAEIFNLMGEKVFQGKIYQSVSLKGFPTGIYVLVIKGQPNIRFIKNKN